MDVGRLCTCLVSSSGDSRPQQEEGEGGDVQCVPRHTERSQTTDASAERRANRNSEQDKHHTAAEKCVVGNWTAEFPDTPVWSCVMQGHVEDVCWSMPRPWTG
jgi:hypothetical protein